MTVVHTLSIYNNDCTLYNLTCNLAINFHLTNSPLHEGDYYGLLNISCYNSI